ncbi:MAG TPA: hypothetical protein VHG51_13970 [Longimicrobiaceae bacterium]|nr:hypothetical protein [Longimicrobiaceae bacterium]
MHPSNPRFALALALLLAAGCGGESPDTSAEDSASAEEAVVVDAASQEAAPPASADPSSAPLAAADIDRWQRGMEAEIQAIREAGTLASARTGEDSLKVLSAATESSTLAAGARAAGVDQERYRFIKGRLSSLAEALTPVEEVADVSQTPPELLQSMKEGREQALARLSAEVPAEVVEALRPRATELRRLDVSLTGERLRAAGMGR